MVDTVGGGRIWWQLMKKKDTCGEEEVNKACLMFGDIGQMSHGLGEISNYVRCPKRTMC